MVSTAEAMRTLQRSLGVVENNIVNASTPGYARQEMSTVANPFNPNTTSTSGGIRSGPMVSSRNPFVEASVWKIQHRAGYSSALSERLTELELSFPITDGAGISGQVDRFFAAVSQWSVAPNSTVARTQVLDRADALAQTFNQTANELGNSSARSGVALADTITQINRIAADITQINKQRRENFASISDAGLDSQMHAALEELSSYVNFSAIAQDDGSFSIYVGGQTPLVIGGHTYGLGLSQSGSDYEVRDAGGVNITAQVTGGKLGAVLQYRNEVLPDIRARLDALASGLADAVNNVLSAGVDQNGNPPVDNLFTYNPAIGAASSLTITGITPDQLAAAALGDPGGNTNALNLIDLQNTGIFSGRTPAQYYSDITARVGDSLNSAKSQVKLQQQLLLQAQTTRQELSGVDINVEAAKLLQLQKGFQACGQVMSVLNEMTETVLGMLR